MKVTELANRFNLKSNGNNLHVCVLNDFELGLYANINKVKDGGEYAEKYGNLEVIYFNFDDGHLHVWASKGKLNLY